MWFKNLTMFQLDSEALEGELATAMESRRRPECGPLEAFSVGFVSPFGPKHEDSRGEHEMPNHVTNVVESTEQ